MPRICKISIGEQDIVWSLWRTAALEERGYQAGLLSISVSLVIETKIFGKDLDVGEAYVAAADE